MDYGPEEPAEQEEDITEPEPEESEAEEPEPEGPEAGPEEPEAEEGEATAEETPEEEPEETDAEPEEEPEETDAEPEEEPEETDAEPEEGPAEETVSGNELVVGGDVIIFPEDYDLSALGTEPADTASIVQAVERQTDIMTAGFACTCFMLGVLAGALVMAGFRLRRV